MLGRTPEVHPKNRTALGLRALGLRVIGFLGFGVFGFHGLGRWRFRPLGPWGFSGFGALGFRFRALGSPGLGLRESDPTLSLNPRPKSTKKQVGTIAKP